MPGGLCASTEAEKQLIILSVHSAEKNFMLSRKESRSNFADPSELLPFSSFWSGASTRKFVGSSDQHHTYHVCTNTS